MKKFLVFIAILCCGVSINAQDTITLQSFPLPNYFAFMYPGSVEIRAFADQYGATLGSDFSGSYRYVNHPVQIYGLAACMDLPKAVREGNADRWISYWENLYGQEFKMDTTKDSSYAYLCLYKADTVPYKLGNSLKVNVWNSQPSYYLDLGMRDHGNLIPPRRVYERFFDTPVLVSDSFYIGVNNRYMDDDGNFLYWPVYLEAFCIRPIQPGSYARDSIVNHYVWSGRTSYWRYSCNSSRYPLIFPILTPPTDTMGNEPDTVSLKSTDLLARYVGVSPNPATEQVRVVSSFGLTAIEAVDLSGHKVYEGKATGYCALVDVSRWPVGIYLLTIHTPIGVTIKRLTVAR